MAISASMVKELREMTGAGMMECKKALTETDGDMDAAVEVLRKSGAAKAEKKASRIAAEGICRVASNGTTAAVVEVNSETDFVAKNEVFQTYVEAVAKQALASSLNGGKDGQDIEAFVAEAWNEDASKTVKDVLVEKTATIGEKLSIRRFEKVSGDAVVSYLHGGGRIGVLVAADGASDDAAKEALTNIAMQVAAMNPQYISRADISDAEIDKMREITIDSSLNDPASLPKPVLNKLIDKAINDKVWSDEDIAIYEEKKSNMNYLFNFLSKEAAAQLTELAMADKASIMAEKIFSGAVEGRISKQLKEISLLDQTYVKAEDGKQTVAKYLESVNKAITISKIVRFEVGEGMEKKNEDFAAEVAAQLG
ncbi:MAG: elongation factor Ts [Lachnospiraceae bacterium]|nr:elongation factor Ts [Lachnospiraceae bacterium]